MDAGRCRTVLAACLPSLGVREVRYLAEGWDSTVFLVDGGLLFRFPKREEVSDWLEQELRLLPELAPRLPAAVPAFCYAVRGCAAFPFTFAGYPLIAGIAADQAALGPEACRALAADLGRFLRALHGFPLARARALGVRPVSTAGGRQQGEAFAAAVRARVAPLFDAGEAAAIGAWFDRAAARGLYAFEPALVHNDLGAEHILVDPGSGRLRGVIDFGDCGIGDPAIDFAGIIGLGERAARTALAAYGAADGAALLRRARIYRQLAPLHEVLYGLDIGTPEVVARGMARVRKQMLGAGRHRGGRRPAGG